MRLNNETGVFNVTMLKSCRQYASRRDLSKLEPSPCTVRKMTPEEREYYGEPNLDPKLLRQRKTPEQVGIVSTLKADVMERRRWSEMIKAERKRLGLTQKEFGQKVGVSAMTICHIERMQNDIKKPTLELLERYFGGK